MKIKSRLLCLLLTSVGLFRVNAEEEKIMTDIWDAAETNLPPDEKKSKFSKHFIERRNTIVYNWLYELIEKSGFQHDYREIQKNKMPPYKIAVEDRIKIFLKNNPDFVLELQKTFKADFLSEKYQNYIPLKKEKFYFDSLLSDVLFHILMDFLPFKMEYSKYTFTRGLSSIDIYCVYNKQVNKDRIHTVKASFSNEVLGNWVKDKDSYALLTAYNLPDILKQCVIALNQLPELNGFKNFSVIEFRSKKDDKYYPVYFYQEEPTGKQKIKLKKDLKWLDILTLENIEAYDVNHRYEDVLMPGIGAPRGMRQYYKPEWEKEDGNKEKKKIK